MGGSDSDTLKIIVKRMGKETDKMTLKEADETKSKEPLAREMAEKKLHFYRFTEPQNPNYQIMIELR